MGLSPQERYTQYFYQWEQRGRGWQFFNIPVDLEPPYTPFIPHDLLKIYTNSNDGTSHTLLSAAKSGIASLFQSKKESDKKPSSNPGDEPLMYPFTDHDTIHEIAVVTTSNEAISLEKIEQFITMVGTHTPLSFEIIGTATEITILFTCRGKSKDWFLSQLQGYFPKLIISEISGYLPEKWNPNKQSAIIDFGLQDEFVCPLRTDNRFKLDPLISFYALLEHLRPGEFGMLQVIFQSLKNPWSGAITQSVGNSKRGGFFVNAPEMVKYAQTKTNAPLCAAIVRVVAQAESFHRTEELALGFARSIVSATSAKSNALIPLSNKGHAYQSHVRNVFLRQSNRLGMILNVQELLPLVHFPLPSVSSKKLKRHIKKTKEAPKQVLRHAYQVGKNVHNGITREIALHDAQRLRHIHIIGATGTGKSTLLSSLIIQDIVHGNGLALIDPHGDLVESVMEHIPEHRLNDVVLIDPADIDFPVGFNLLSAHSEIEKIVLSSDLVAMFRRLATSWGDQMNSILANAFLAFLENTDGGTLLDLRRFLVEPAFRQKFLHTVSDPAIVYYWKKEFPLLRKGSVASLITRLDTFLRPKLIRYMMAQKRGLDFKSLIESKKIILIKLSQGLIGRENSYLLGTLLVAKLHQVAQARQSIEKHLRQPFFLYIDEFQNFITPSLEEILSGARKYGMGLVLAHQGMRQLLKEDSYVANSVIANAGTRICFRLGDTDAEKLEKGFSYFDRRDLQSLGVGEAIMRVDQAEHDFNIQTTPLDRVDDELAADRKRKIIMLSRSKYSRPRAEIEELLRQMHDVSDNRKKSYTKEEQKTPPRTKESQPNEVTPETSFSPPDFTEIDKVAGKQEIIEREEKQEEQRKHIYLQKWIKQMAESRGFKTVIEVPTKDGKGRVDVGLSNKKTRIACEISVTTSAKHELKNIQKCLKDKYSEVLVISPRKEHLSNIKIHAEKHLSKAKFQQLHFFEPEEVVPYLDTLLPAMPETEQVINGYRVKVKYKDVSEAEAQNKQEAITNIIMGATRRTNIKK